MRKSSIKWKVFGVILALVYVGDVMAAGSADMTGNSSTLSFSKKAIDMNYIKQKVKKIEERDAKNTVMSLEEVRKYLAEQNVSLQELCEYILREKKLLMMLMKEEKAHLPKQGRSMLEARNEKFSIAAEKLWESLIYNTGFVDRIDIVELVLNKQTDKIETFRNRVFSKLKDFIEVGAKNYPLHYVCEKGNLNYAKILVELGAYVNKTENLSNCTPLFVACKSGKLNLVKYLVKKGAYINKENKFGETPLDIAQKKQYEDIVQYLEDNGAKNGNGDNDSDSDFIILSNNDE